MATRLLAYWYSHQHVYVRWQYATSVSFGIQNGVRQGGILSPFLFRFYIRQLRRIRRSLDSESLATLIYAVVNSRMDYCNTVLSGAPRTVTDKLQRVITGTWKFDRGLGQILHDQLHWLDVPDRVLIKFAVTVHQCLNGRAPPYLSEHCIPVFSADTRRHLRSANRHLLVVPRSWLNTYGRRAFSVAGPIAWNSPPDFIRDPTISTDCFRRLLKTYLFARY